MLWKKKRRDRQIYQKQERKREREKNKEKKKIISNNGFTVLIGNTMHAIFY